jgi:Rrf2 family protein
MWLSSTAQQAIHATLCIAGSEDEGLVRVDEIAAAMNAPRNYLSKTLHILTRAGVLRSERGPRGGFRLAMEPDQLTLAQIVAPFEPVGERRCLVGRPTCGDDYPCPAHHHWKKVAAELEAFFNGTTVAQLLHENSPAAAEARETIRSIRQSTQGIPNGSVTRRIR